jgi:type IV secretion system protein VirB11
MSALLKNGAPEQDKILNAILRHLLPYYTHRDHEEIAINQPGEVWIKRRRAAPGESLWFTDQNPNLTFEYLELVCRALANANNQKFGDGEGKTPVVYTQLPGGHRFTAGMFKNFIYDIPRPRGGVCMAIRQAPRDDNVIDFAHYGLVEGVRVEAAKKFKEMADESTDDLSKLRDAINKGSHLVVSGATGTGKTTLLNKILTELDPKLRLMTIEDTRELAVPHPNRVHIVLSRTEQVNKFDDGAAINLVTRMTPDIIICGEVSTGNAKTIWELTGSGHGSMMTTIHAEDPESALATFCKRIQHQDKSLDVAGTIAEMRERFTVVQIIKDPLTGKRRISAIETFKD